MRSNIYIRKENEEAWNNIADKSAWVNDMLHVPDTLIVKEATPIIPQEAAAKKPITPVKQDESLEFCKHNMVMGMCKKGCK